MFKQRDTDFYFFAGMVVCLLITCVLVVYSLLVGEYALFIWYIAAFLAFILWLDHWFVTMRKKRKNDQKSKWGKEYSKEFIVSAFLLICSCYFAYAGIQQQIFLVHSQIPLLMPEVLILLGLPTIICLGIFAAHIVILIDLGHRRKSPLEDTPSVW